MADYMFYLSKKNICKFEIVKPAYDFTLSQPVSSEWIAYFNNTKWDPIEDGGVPGGTWDGTKWNATEVVSTETYYIINLVTKSYPDLSGVYPTKIRCEFSAPYFDWIVIGEYGNVEDDSLDFILYATSTTEYDTPNVEVSSFNAIQFLSSVNFSVTNIEFLV